jgi:hypothetical protein
MDYQRYVLWRKVWDWFARRSDKKGEFSILYELLEKLWEEERSKATPQELASYGASYELDRKTIL